LLRFGSRGALVRLLQDGLNAAGVVSPALNADGIFGPKTHRAVKLFQANQGLTADGIVGPKTRSKLQLAETGPSGADQRGEAGAGAPDPSMVTHQLGVGPESDGTETGPATGETAPAGSVDGAYERGELESSAQSGGLVQDNEPGAVFDPETGEKKPYKGSGYGTGTALLYDFEPGSSAIRPVHAQLIGLIRARLGWSLGRDTGDVLQVYGTMDEIETFIQKSKVDGARAAKVMAALDPGGYFTYGSGCSSCPKVDVVGAGLGLGGSAEMRASGRSVFMKYVVDKPKKKPASGSKLPAEKSRRWKVSVDAGVESGVVLGSVVLQLVLENRDSGRQYGTLFLGNMAGVGLGVSHGTPVGIGGEFETAKPVSASAFEDLAAQFRTYSMGGPLLSVGQAIITFPGLNTEPEWIYMSGVSLAQGSPFTGYGSTGNLTKLTPLSGGK
jgi:peptidoglycan hydrolase-like protein with peptidoglycan-binding domain